MESYVNTLYGNVFDFQGRVIPCDFIGVVKSQQPVYLKGNNDNVRWSFLYFNWYPCLFALTGMLNCLGEVVNNHDELMSNFFAQPDALAYGKVCYL